MPVPPSWVDSAVQGAHDVRRVDYATDVASHVLPVSALLSAFYVVMIVVHPLVLETRLGPAVIAGALLSAVVAALVALLAWRKGISRRWGHVVMAGLIALTTADALAHMVVSSDPQESVTFLLILVGAGTALLSYRWFLSAALGVWLAWGLAILLVGGSPHSWGQWILFMLAGTLLAAVINMVRRSSIDVAVAAIQSARRAATEDSVTGLYNRRGLALLGREVVGVARRTNEAVHCTFLDIDGLKAVNDTMGHDAGDRLIAAVGDALSETARSTDVVARWGGDEFVVVGLGPGLPLPDLDARVQGHLLQQQLQDPAIGVVRISFGRALLEPWDEGGLERLVWAADRDMYERRNASGRRTPYIVTIDGTVPPVH